ncbi:MAG: DUF748 domain-containing protein, partial [Desulfobacteraceae bacterium]|nr:DUF748 domain-containing protein [Desulfobacteraceae bacterium]
MKNNPEKKKSSISLIQRSAIVLVCLFFIYVILGFWVVPPILKPRLENELSRQLERKVTIEKIKLNPLILSATTINLSVYEENDEPFAGFRELFVDFQLASILNWAFTVKEIQLVAPFGVLRLLPGNRLNIDDLLKKFSHPEPKSEANAELPPAILERFQVVDGKFTVEDFTAAEPIRDTIYPIAFSLENLSTFKERPGAYKFVGVGTFGGQYQLT